VSKTAQNLSPNRNQPELIAFRPRMQDVWAGISAPHRRSAALALDRCSLIPFSHEQAGKFAPLPAGIEADVRKKRRQATFCQ
jgi:hypothetical protein